MSGQGDLNPQEYVAPCRGGGRVSKPLVYLNAHGARFLLLGYTVEDSAKGPVRCAELVDEGGRVWIPLGAFRANFTAAREGDA